MSKLTQSIAILGVVAGLGVTALPLSSYAAPVIDGTAPTEGAVAGATYDGTLDGEVEDKATITLKIVKRLSIELDKKKADLTDGSTQDKIRVTVDTNNGTGYSLKMTGTTAAAEGKALPTGADGSVLLNANGVDFIKAGDLAQSTSTWGYKLAAATGEGAPAAGTLPATAAAWTGVTTAGAEIMSSTVGTETGGEAVDVTFGADVKSDQAAGVYTGQVTFTATDNPAATVPTA